MAEPMPVAIIIYGASGDLSQLKLVPAERYAEAEVFFG